MLRALEWKNQEEGKKKLGGTRMPERGPLDSAFAEPTTRCTCGPPWETRVLPTPRGLVLQNFLEAFPTTIAPLGAGL